VARAEQEYLVNTPVLVTRLYDRAGAGVEITDFAPRFHQYGRLFSPMMLVRQIRRIAGNPRIRVRLRPAQRYGRVPAETTCGSNHIRYAGADLVLRLTTDASITALMEENLFYLEDAVTLLLGPDETVQGVVAPRAASCARAYSTSVRDLDVLDGLPEIPTTARRLVESLTPARSYPPAGPASPWRRR